MNNTFRPWRTKVFKKKEAFDKWVKEQSHKYQWQEVFINNAYGVEYRKLLVIDIP